MLRLLDYNIIPLCSLLDQKFPICWMGLATLPIIKLSSTSLRNVLKAASSRVVAAIIYLIWTLMLLHVLHHNEMCIFPYQIMASILLYHSYMKDISRLYRASLCMMRTKNMNHIIRNVFVCTSRSFFLLLCYCLRYGSISSTSARKKMW